MLTLVGAVDSLCVFGAPSSKTSLVLAAPPLILTPFSPLSKGRRPKVLWTLPVTPAVICASSETLRLRVGGACTIPLFRPLPRLACFPSLQGTPPHTFTASVAPAHSARNSPP